MTSNVFLARLYRTPLVTVAAIKGACPAGGCCLSMCCDVRIMTEQVHPLHHLVPVPIHFWEFTMLHTALCADHLPGTLGPPVEVRWLVKLGDPTAIFWQTRGKQTIGIKAGVRPARQGHIGLNEVAIGISVPLYWGRLMARIVGDRVAESLCSFARLVSPQEALKVPPSACPCVSSNLCITTTFDKSVTSLCAAYPALLLQLWPMQESIADGYNRGEWPVQVGLVDQLVAGREQLMPAAEAAMGKLLGPPDTGRVIVKARFREGFSREWEAYPAEEAPGAWAMLAAPATVALLEATLARLSGKKGAAAKL